jgi:hypothetical protein
MRHINRLIVPVVHCPLARPYTRDLAVHTQLVSGVGSDANNEGARNVWELKGFAEEYDRAWIASVVEVGEPDPG